MYSRAYTYDSNGNTLSDETVAAGYGSQADTKTYTYDSKNRLISFTDAADTGIYTYDTAGRRLSKTYGGSTTEYLYCTTCRYAQVLEERDGLGNITAEYYIGNDLISQDRNNQEFSYLYDGHGSVRRLINKYGSISAQYSYDAYGILLDSFGTVDNDFRYSGEQFDPHLDQYYLRARYYNQNVGRFSSMDSWGGISTKPLSLNKYNYTEGNPVMGIDPSGRMSLFEAIVIVSVIGVMASCAEPNRGTASCGKCKGRKDKQDPPRDLFDSIIEAVRHAEQITYSKYASEAKEFEFVSEIAKAHFKGCDAKCYAVENPHTDRIPVKIINFNYNAPYKVVAYWHNHPDVWWYNGYRYNPLELSEPDKATAREIGGGTAYMTYKADSPSANPENTVKEKRLFWSVNDGDGTW